MKKILMILVAVFTLAIAGCETPEEEQKTCDEGYVLVDDECVLDEVDPITCDEGYTLNEETNTCEEDEVEPITCEEGYELVGEQCLKIIEEIDFNDVYPEYNSYYQVFVRSFADSDNDGVGDFNGITAKLDYLEALGVTGLWLMPIHPSPGVGSCGQSHNCHPA